MRQLPESILSPENIVGMDPRYVLYQLDEETVLQKSLFKVTSEEIEKGKRVARNTMLLGLPALITFEPVKIGDDYGIIYENAGPNALGDLIMSDPSHFDDYLDDFVDLAHRMHGTHVGAGSFPSVKDLFQGYFEEGVRQGHLTEADVVSLGRMIDAIPDTDTYLHGHYQPRSTRYVKGELTLTQLERACYGHPAFDFFSTALGVAMPAEVSDDARCRNVCRLDKATARRFWDAYVSRYFGCRDQEDAQNMIRLMEFGQWLEYVYAMVAYPLISEQQRDYMLVPIRNVCIPNIDRWIEEMKPVWERFS